jgi:hypothetical protein
MKPTCNRECGTCRYQIDPTHCADVVSGEQGPSSEALALRDRLSTIVDEAFGLQEVLDTDALLNRLEHLLAERARQHEEVRRERERLRSELAEMTGCATHWCAEGGRSEREHRETLIRCRTAAQILIAEIGASGPEGIEETARRVVERIQELKGVAEDLCANCDGEGMS